jgi:hypothetical protein
VADAMEPGRQDVDQEAADELVGGERQTPARWSAEVAATKTMLTRTQEHFGLTPQTLAADAANGSGQMLGRLMGRGIEPHIPILDREHQTKGHFTRADFTFDAAAISSSVPAVRSGARRWDHAEARMVRRLLAFPISRSHALVLPLNRRKFGNSVSQFSDTTLEIGHGGVTPCSLVSARRYSRTPSLANFSRIWSWLVQKTISGIVTSPLGLPSLTFSRNHRSALTTRANCHYRARGNAGGASGLPAAQFPLAHHGATTAIIAELAALALMAEWAAFLSAR